MRVGRLLVNCTLHRTASNAVSSVRSQLVMRSEAKLILKMLIDKGKNYIMSCSCVYKKT